MRAIRFSALTVLTGLWLSTSMALAAGFHGSFQGELNGSPVQLTLRQQGDAVSGEMVIEGYRYTLQGEVSDDALAGEFHDPTAGGSGEVQASWHGRELRFTLSVPGGQALQMSFTAGRTAKAAPTAPQGTSPRSSKGAGGDPQLVGRWRYTETYTSGEFTAASDSFLTILPDGSYRIGEGALAAGDAGSSAVTSGGSGEVGRWRTQGNIIYIQEGGAGWEPYARYYIERGTLMFTFANGKRQLWDRVE